MRMNEKGRQTRLLAAIAVLAMVVCAFAIAMPSDDVDAVATPNIATYVTSEDIANWTEDTAGTFKLKENWTLSGDDGIPAGVILYTDGKTIDASSNKLTVNGVLYVNGTGGTLIIKGTDDTDCVFDGKVVIDVNGCVKISSNTFIGTGGIANVTSGTVEIADKEDTVGFTVTLTQGSAANISTYPIYETDTIKVEQNATLTITGTVTSSGTGAGKILNNGIINFTGSGKVTKTTIDTSGTGTIDGYSDTTDYGTLESLDALDENGALKESVSVHGNVSTGTVVVTDTIAFTVGAGSTFTGIINAIGAEGAVVASVSGPFTVDEDVMFAADATTATEITMTPTAGTTVSGTISFSGKVGIAESMTVPNGSTLSIVSATTDISITGGKTLTILGDVTGTANKQIKANGTSTGSVQASNITAVQQYVDGTVGSVDSKPYTNVEQLIADLNAGYNVTVGSAASPVSNVTITINKDVTMNGNTLTVFGTGTVTVDSGVTFTMNAGSQIIYGDDSSDFTFAITGTSASSRAIVNITEANLCIPVQKGDYALVEVSGKDMEINNAFSSYYVGYGRTAYMTGTAVTADIDVVGTLYLSGTLRDNSTISIYQGGEVIVSEGETFQIIGTMNIDGGSAQIDGTLTVGNSSGAASLNVEDGIVKVSSTGVLTISGNTANKPYNILNGSIYNEGTVNMYSKLIGAIANSGTVNFDGVHENRVGGYATAIFMVKSRAVLNVQSVTAVSGALPLTVTDEGCYLKTVTTGSTADSVTVGDEDAPWADVNCMTLSNVKNVKITVTVAYENVSGYSERQPVNTMAFEGSVTPVTNSTSTIGITAGAVDVIGTVTLGKVNINVGSGAVLNVSGTINAPEAGAAATGTTLATFYSINGSGTVNVTGLIKSIDELDADTLRVNAIHYVATEDSRNWNFYTTLKAALDAGVTDMDVLGDLYILEDTTIPTGVTVEGTGNAYIGSSNLTDVTLVIENGGKLIIGKVTVYGTLDIRNTDTGLENTGEIVADTSNINEDDKTALYTNIYNALSSAGDGDVVTVTKPLQDGVAIVYIDSNLTVPSGVTLVLPAGKEICILAGATLAVDGTFDVKGDITSRGYSSATAESPVKNSNEQYYFNNADARSKKAAISVTGEIVSNAELAYTTYSIAGAYYLMDGRFHITTLDKAAPLIGETDNYQMSTYGSVTGTDISITGTADILVTFNVKGDLTVSSVMMQNAIMNVDAGKAVTGTFGSAEGTVTFQYVKIGTTAFTMTQKAVQSGETSTPTLFIDGNVVRYEGAADSNYPNKDMDALVEFDGTVKISDFGADFENTVDGDGSGNVVIAAGADVSFARNANTDTMTMTLDNLTLSVDGTLTVNNGATLNAYTAGDNEATVIVIGTLDVVKKTDTQDAGTARIRTLYVGGTPDQISYDRTYSANLGSEAIVTGAGITGLACVYEFPGSTVNAENTTGKGFGSVEFYYDDALIVTVWAAQNTQINDVYPAGQIGNALFQGWMYEDANGVMQYTSEPVSINDSMEDMTTVTVGTHDKVYASVDYDAYILVFYVDAGVDAIYVDGDIVDSKGLVGQGGDIQYPVAYVSAGTHTVTVKLSNGYTGVVEMNFNGETVTDGKIDIDASTYAGQIFKVSITNIDVTQSAGSSDDGLGLTDYLLIVLVVLIVVMAIMVALRLMRS